MTYEIIFPAAQCNAQSQSIEFLADDSFVMWLIGASFFSHKKVEGRFHGLDKGVGAITFFAAIESSCKAFAKHCP